jgi:hypothetical protein
VVAWGIGGCSDDGANRRFHLLEIASHGYLVIASGRILSGPAAPPREPRPAAHVPVAVASLSVGYGGMFPEPNGGAAASVAVSWLDWQLRGARQAPTVRG